MPIINQKRAFPIVQTGEYVSTIKRIEEVEGKFPDKNGEIKPQLQVEFDLGKNAAGEDQQLRGWFSLYFSPKSKLFSLATAAFGGKAIPETYNLNTDDLLGRKVRLVVVVEDKDGREFSKIIGYRPANAQPQPVPQPEQKQAAPPSDSIPF